MNIICAICSESLMPSDDVFHTPCRHIFHFVCLTQWLERSRSCPQCREKTTSHTIHRLYFNFSNIDTTSADIGTLQDKTDKLNFQLLLKEQDVKHYTAKSEKLGKQNVELKKEVHKLEAELKTIKSVIDALKDQIKYFKQQNSEMESKRQEIEQLRKEIETYKNIQILMEASTEHVDEVISKTCEPAALITYICVMKREMTVSLNKRKELRNKLRSLQQELARVITERNLLSEERVKRKKLEEDLMLCENEKMYLQNKVKQLERKRTNKFDSDEDALSSDLKSSDGCEQNKIKTVIKSAANERAEDIDTKDKHQYTKSETNSPYLPLKSGGVFVLKHSVQKRSTTNLHPSILTKKARIEPTSEKVRANAITYDGFGGHSKHERFPSIKKKIKLDPKQKSLI